MVRAVKQVAFSGEIYTMFAPVCTIVKWFALPNRQHWTELAGSYPVQREVFEMAAAQENQRLAGESNTIFPIEPAL